MAIKRLVTVTCDGPCGKVINGKAIPQGWVYVKIMDVHNTPGVKTPYSVAALCPDCKTKLALIMNREGFAFTEVNKELQS